MPQVIAQFNVLQSLENAFTVFVSYLPKILGALVVLIVGYIIARLIRTAITKLLNRFGLDDRLKSGEGGHYVERFSPQGSPARLAGTTVFIVIMLFVLSAAISTLAIPALTAFMNQVLGYLPRVIAALVIFLVAAAVAGAVGGLAHRTMGDTPTGQIVRTAGPTLVMAIAVFMILTQLAIAPAIVTATYIALIGAIALGSAIAFGLGGQEAAAHMINSGYNKAREEQETVKRDVRVGRERGQQDAQRAQERAQREVGPGGGGGGAGGGAEQPTQTQPGGGSYRAT